MEDEGSRAERAGLETFRAPARSSAGDHPGPVPHPARADPLDSPESDAARNPHTLPDEVRACALPRPDQGVRLEEGIVYSRPGAPLALDLALPRGQGPHPWLVLFHGGGWRAGERIHLRDEILALAGLGYAAASVDYRLVDHGARNAFPAAVTDARCAVRYLRRHARRFELDPQRAGAIGFSSGGHLAEMLGTAAGVEGLDRGCADRETSPAVQAVIAYFAPSDLRRGAHFARAADRVRDRFLGTPPEQDPERADLASPLVHVGGDSPPTLLVHGTEDRVVPLAQSRTMRDALAQAGVPVELVELPGVGHGFRLFSHMAGTRPGACTSLAFLDATLRRSDGE